MVHAIVTTTSSSTCKVDKWMMNLPPTHNVVITMIQIQFASLDDCIWHLIPSCLDTGCPLKMPRPIILPEGRQVSPVPHSARSQNSTTTPALISNAPGPVGAWWSEEAEESSERERGHGRDSEGERSHGRRRAHESSLSSPQPLNPVFLSSPVMLATLCLWWWQFMHDSSKFFIRLITHSNTQLGGLLPMGLPVPRPVMRDDDWIKQELYGPLVHLPSPSTLANTMLYSAAGRCIWNYQNYTPFQYQNQVVIIYLNIAINNKKGSHTFIEHMCVRLVIALMILQNKKAWQNL